MDALLGGLFYCPCINAVAIMPNTFIDNAKVMAKGQVTIPKDVQHARRVERQPPYIHYEERFCASCQRPRLCNAADAQGDDKRAKAVGGRGHIPRQGYAQGDMSRARIHRYEYTYLLYICNPP